MRPAITWSLLATVLFAMPGPAIAESNASVNDALTSGTLIFNLRPRYEDVDQSGLETGDAFIMRTLLGWETGSWKGWSGLGELINVGRANNDYNDSLNGKSSTRLFPSLTTRTLTSGATVIAASGTY